MRHGNGRSLLQNAPVRTTDAGQLELLSTPQTTPNLPALRLWHSSADGYVSFHRKVNGEYLGVASVPVSELNGEGQQWLPGLLAKLATDSYFTVNAMYRPGVRVRERERYVATVVEGQRVRELKTCAVVEHYQRGTGGLRYAYRASEGVRWLTAAWVDCDGYRVGLDAPATVAGLMRAWREEHLPVPSFLVASGRGAWAFWKLLDERNPAQGMARVGKVTLYADSPVQASSRAVRLHRAVNHALAARVAHLGADGAAGDTARTCRVPGSWHSGAGAHVEILPVLRDGAMAVYTLSDLARWLNLGDVLVSSTRMSLKSSATLTDAQLSQRLRAYQARHRRVHDAVVKLSELRGGFGEGHRHHAAFHCALAGFRAALDADAVRQRVRHLTGCMRPPLSSRDTDAVLRDAYRKATKRQAGKPPSYATVAKLLDVSTAERLAVGLVAREQKPRRLDASGRRALVRELVDASVTLGQGVPSQPAMVRLLASRGVGASQATISGDYRALGVASARRGGRPPRPLLELPATAPPARPWESR